MVILVFHDQWDGSHQLVGDDEFVNWVLRRWKEESRIREPSRESIIVGKKWRDLQWFEVFDRDMNDITHEFHDW